MGTTVASHSLDQLLDLVNRQVLPRPQGPVWGTAGSDCSIYTTWGNQFQVRLFHEKPPLGTETVGTLRFLRTVFQHGLAANFYFYQALDKIAPPQGCINKASGCRMLLPITVAFCSATICSYL